MNYANIKDKDIANGEGVRVSLFVSGCTHHCKNCFNPETWDFDYGNEFADDVQEKLLQSLQPSYIKGLTLLGGEPLHPRNQEAVLNFVRKVRQLYGSNKNIWCYTGYIYDVDFIEGGRAYTQFSNALLDCIDILVDGPFVDELKNITLKFRGSSNQRVIDLKKTKELNKIVLYLE